MASFIPDTLTYSGARVREVRRFEKLQGRMSTFGEIFRVVLRGVEGSRMLENNKYKKKPYLSGKIMCKTLA